MIGRQERVLFCFGAMFTMRMPKLSNRDRNDGRWRCAHASEFDGLTNLDEPGTNAVHAYVRIQEVPCGCLCEAVDARRKGIRPGVGSR